MSRDSETSAEPWYERAFRDDYRLVYAHRDLASARAEVGWLVEQGLAGRVLDLCCGFGRHTLALAERGLDAFGLDLSADLLAAARELEGYERLLAGRLVRADATRVPFAEAAFDGVAVLFSSFGYFGEEGDARMLGEVARVLRPGGLAVLDLMNPARIRAGLVPASTRSGPGFELAERRSLAEGGRRVVKEVELTLTDASPGSPRVRRWREDVRMYEPAEVRALLARAGLSLERAAGDFGGAPEGVAAGWEGPAPEAPRMLLFARAEPRAKVAARA